MATAFTIWNASPCFIGTIIHFGGTWNPTGSTETKPSIWRTLTSTVYGTNNQLPQCPTLHGTNENSQRALTRRHYRRCGRQRVPRGRDGSCRPPGRSRLRLLFPPPHGVGRFSRLDHRGTLTPQCPSRLLCGE